MTRSPSLRELLEIENDESLLQFVCPETGILIWPAMRNQFFRLIMSDLLYESQPLLDTNQRIPKGRVAKVALRALLHNALTRPKKSHLLIRASGAGLINVKGYSFNRYTDYFSGECGGGAWSFEDLPSYVWPLPREKNRLSYTTPAIAAINLRSRLRVGSRHQRLAEQMVDRVDLRAGQLTGWRMGDERRAWLIKHCARRAAAYPLQRRYMEHWLHRVRPSIFLVEEGCYGHMAVFNATARLHGVTVAEFQHGAVTSGHDAYNVAPALKNSAAYRRTLPHHFLGYGCWWNAQFNMPVDKVVIGNPHRDAALALARPIDVAPARKILILGDGRELHAHLKLCRETAALVQPAYEVQFRPHPEERQHVWSMPAEAFEGFSVDRETDIYTSLASTHSVVAELSTGLFDAVGLAQRIFVWDTEKSRFGLPEHPFAKFESASQLAEAIRIPDRGILDVSGIESIWASDWQRRFSTFLNEPAPVAA